MARVFVDTNVLAYQFDAGEPAKQAVARRALGASEHDLVVSTQVMLELFVVITGKLQPPVPYEAAQQVLAGLARLYVVPSDARLVLRAARTALDHKMSVWDAMILEAARRCGM